MEKITQLPLRRDDGTQGEHIQRDSDKKQFESATAAEFNWKI